MNDDYMEVAFRPYTGLTLQVVNRGFICHERRLRMEFVREILDAELLNPIVNMPEAMKHGKVEVIILPVPRREEDTPSVVKSRSALDAVKRITGCLHQYAVPSLIAGEKNAWRKAVLKKTRQGKYAPQSGDS
jgi:hypothetical protein